VFDFEQQAGYAATARLNVKLAGRSQRNGYFSSFTQRRLRRLVIAAQQRSIDDVSGDFNATVAAENFCPEEAHLRLSALLQLGKESRNSPAGSPRSRYQAGPDS
jgi:hypothetical protein